MDTIEEKEHVGVGFGALCVQHTLLIVPEPWRDELTGTNRIIRNFNIVVR
jgi:hypothetical protein